MTRLLPLLLAGCLDGGATTVSVEAALREPDPVRVEAEQAAQRALQREAARAPRDTWVVPGDAVARGPATLHPLESARWLHGEARDTGVMVYVFWETWCAECIAELPEIGRLATKLDGEVQVVGLTTLSRGGSATRALSILEGARARFPVAVVPASLHERARISEVPHAIVTRDGDVVWRGSPRALSATRLLRLAR